MLDSIYHIILKSFLGREIVSVLLLCVTLKASIHNVSRKSVNHYWFIDLNAWPYFTPGRDVI